MASCAKRIWRRPQVPFRVRGFVRNLHFCRGCRCASTLSDQGSHTDGFSSPQADGTSRSVPAADLLALNSSVLALTSFAKAWRRVVEAPEDDESLPSLQSVRRVAVGKRTRQRSSDPEKIDLLRQEGFGPRQLNMLLENPAALASTSFEELVSILNVLKTLNIQGQRAGDVVVRYPRFIRQSAKDLECKIKFFEESGIYREYLERFIIACPAGICLSLKTLQKRVDQLRAVGVDDNGLCNIMWKNPRSFTLDIGKRIAILKDFGASQTVICKYLHNPQILCMSGLLVLVQKMKVLQQLGFDKHSKDFFRAFFCLSATSNERILKRFHLLIARGLSHSDVFHIVRTHPPVLTKTEKSLSESIDYLVNVLNRDVKDLVKYPVFLSCSLQDRIIPRLSIVIKKQEERNYKRDYSLGYLLAMSNESFEKRFALLHQEPG